MYGPRFEHCHESHCALTHPVECSPSISMLLEFMLFCVSLSFSISLQALLFGVVLNFPPWFALFDFFGALRQWRRGNIALITTLPVLDCLISVQHLQPRCLEDRFLPQQSHFSTSFSHLQAVLRPPCILHLLAQEIHRQMTPQDLSSHVPSSRKLSRSTPELLCATSPRKNFKTWCSQSSSEQKRSLLGLCVFLDESIRHPPGSRGSAQGFLVVSNLCRPGTEEKGEEDVLRVPCIAWDIAQEMEWRFCEKHNLNLSHAWVCNIMCDVRIDCAHLYRLKCGVWEVYLFTPPHRRLPGNWKFPASEKQLPEQEKRLSKSLLQQILLCMYRTFNIFFCSVQVEDRQ